jgi:hypothetical protein
MRALTWADFANGEGTVYEVAIGEDRFELTLALAESLSSSHREGRSFRLEFVGPVDPVLPQATYTFRANGSDCEIFIVPVERKPAGTRYEAIFN